MRLMRPMPPSNECRVASHIDCVVNGLRQPGVPAWIKGGPKSKLSAHHPFELGDFYLLGSPEYASEDETRAIHAYANCTY
jgi:hypothetical protein